MSEQYTVHLSTVERLSQLSLYQCCWTTISAERLCQCSWTSISVLLKVCLTCEFMPVLLNVYLSWETIPVFLNVHLSAAERLSKLSDYASVVERRSQSYCTTVFLWAITCLFQCYTASTSSLLNAFLGAAGEARSCEASTDLLSLNATWRGCTALGHLHVTGTAHSYVTSTYTTRLVLVRLSVDLSVNNR